MTGAPVLQTFSLAGGVPDFVFPLWHEAFGDSAETVCRLLSAASQVHAAFVPADFGEAECAADTDTAGTQDTAGRNGTKGTENAAGAQDTAGRNGTKCTENAADAQDTAGAVAAESVAVGRGADCEEDSAVLPCGYSPAGIVCAFDVSAGDRRGKYFYAVCTAIRFRGRGVMRSLLEYACGEAEAQGCAFAFLIPAKESYFPMYEKLGFDFACPGLISADGARTSADAGVFSPLSLIPFDGDLKKLYGLYLRSPQTVVRKSEKLFALSPGELPEGAEIAYLSQKGSAVPEGYVIFERISKKSLNILEIRACSDAIGGIIQNEILPGLYPAGKTGGKCGADGTGADIVFSTAYKNNISPCGTPAAGSGENRPPVFAAERKALFRFFGESGFIPALTPVDLFLEL